MRTTKPMLSLLVAAGLMIGAAGPVLAQAHSHGGHADGPAVADLTLDSGRKWQTDDVLRQAMDDMRGAMVAAVGPIHGQAFTAAEYGALAARLQERVDYVVANCKLPVEADEQLHLVVADLLDGIGTMGSDGERIEGAARVVQALDAYGRHFDHPGWQPIAH